MPSGELRHRHRGSCTSLRTVSSASPTPRSPSPTRSAPHGTRDRLSPPQVTVAPSIAPAATAPAPTGRAGGWTARSPRSPTPCRRPRCSGSPCSSSGCSPSGWTSSRRAASPTPPANGAPRARSRATSSCPPGCSPSPSSRGSRCTSVRASPTRSRRTRYAAPARPARSGAVADAETFFGTRGPRHPYSRGLLQALPDRAFTPIPGMPPELGDLPEGCVFAARCDRATEACTDRPLTAAAVACHHPYVPEDIRA